MSSTTERRGERGQVLVIFAGGLIAFVLVAALVFDVGQNLFDWRAQRDAADAAALAGARYIANATCYANPSIATCPEANAAALAVARLNGYGDLDGDGVSDRGEVTVSIPPGPETSFGGLPGYIEVEIHTDRPSFFAAVINVITQNVDALAVAGNNEGVALPYSLLAINDDCSPTPSGQVGGNGVVNVGGNVQVDSPCNGAFQINGGPSGASITAPECTVVGSFQRSGKPWIDCDGDGVNENGNDVNENGTASGDPLKTLDPPPVQGPPPAIEYNGPGLNAPPKWKIPNGCPGSVNPSTAANPIGCTISGGGDGIIRFGPGDYYGGISFNNAWTVYLEPGVYRMMGGGFTVQGQGAKVITVNGNNSTTKSEQGERGILIYNTEDPFYSDECGDGTAPAGACLSQFRINGSTGGWVYLRADNEVGIYPGLLFFQDRKLFPQPDFVVNGDTGVVELFGTIYAPKAGVVINGTPDDTIAAQVVANTFKITGNGGFTVTYESEGFIYIKGAGLVE